MREGFFTDLVAYGLLQSYVLGLLISAILALVDRETGWSKLGLVSGWPVLGQLAFFFVTHDFYIYCFHRLQHKSNLLWRTHEAHHSVDDVDWLSGTRSHAAEILINQSIEFLPIVLLGAAPEVAFMKATLDAIWGMYIHSNLACRLNALYMIARAGSGHIGSSFSSLDIVTWLYLTESRGDAYGDGENQYFSSKGHDAPGLYAVMLALEKLPFDMIHRLRQLNGLPGHPDLGTPGIVTNTGSLGMGISKAKGLVLGRRLRGLGGRVFVMTGDGELQEGQIWESLIGAANLGLHEIVAIVDHNKLQSDTFVERTSSLGDLEGKFRSFGWRVERVNRHDFDELSEALGSAAGATDRRW